MLYIFYENTGPRIRSLLCMAVCVLSLQGMAQVRWDGEGGDGEWTTGANWVGNIVPLPSDDVLLDNSLFASGYTVALPPLTSVVTVRSIIILPAAGKLIQCTLPATNTATPALVTTGPGYGITIYNGGIFMNASGSSSSVALSISDSLRINDGGQYIHHTRSGHAAIVSVLSKRPGTEKGIFVFDVPGGGYTIASTGRTFGTLVVDGTASGGIQVYATSAASPLTINGDFIIKPGVTVNLDITAATIIKGDYLQEGGVFNLASQANNNIVYVQGNLLQHGGVITETAGGFPAIECNGSGNQGILLTGIANDVALRINNNAGVSLAADLVLPYQLSLISGTVHAQSFLITLLAGCSLSADSLYNNNFIDGALRKRGMVGVSHFLFPVGKGITKRWMEVKEATGDFTVEFFKSDPHLLAAAAGAGIHHISSIEYWSLQATSIPSAKIELSFDNVNSGGVTDMATLRIAQLASGSWADLGNTGTTGTPGSAGAVTSNSSTVFDAGNNYFALASSDAFQNPLPLQLLSFNWRVNDAAVILRWTTAASWRPAYFELQSSLDGNHFSKLNTIPFVNGQTNYQYTDWSIGEKKPYYRLLIAEQNGLRLYSKTIYAAQNAEQPVVIRLLPSVVTANAELLIESSADQKVQVKIQSSDGRLMHATKLLLLRGKNRLPLQLSGFAAGVYVISVTNSKGSTFAARFVKTE
ncbi:MAG: hypothetical protein ABIU63_09995 [Chitinophagaceae bacterium]